MARKDPYCTCGRPQSDHKEGYGECITGCKAFTLTGRGGQLKIIRMLRPHGPRNNRAPVFLVECPQCNKQYERHGYLRDLVTRRSCRKCREDRKRSARNPRPVPLTGMSKPSRFLHGTRARYVSGCRCKPCKEANAEYSRMNQKMVRMGDTNKLVPVTRVKAHLEKLREVGIGLRSIADVAKVGLTLLQQIRRGLKDHTREKTQAAILAVTAEACLNNGHRVDAGPTHRRIAWMLEQGYTKQAIARALGSKGKAPALQFRADRVTARNARLVQKLYEDMQSGRVGSLSAELPVD